MKLPKFLKKYFWEVDFAKLDTERSRYFILLRIMEYGDERAALWVVKNFDKNEIKNALSKFRGLSPQSANYWSIIYGIDRKSVLCLKRRYMKERKKLWPY